MPRARSLCLGAGTVRNRDAPILSAIPLRPVVAPYKSGHLDQARTSHRRRKQNEAEQPRFLFSCQGLVPCVSETGQSEIVTLRSSPLFRCDLWSLLANPVTSTKPELRIGGENKTRLSSLAFCLFAEIRARYFSSGCHERHLRAFENPRQVNNTVIKYGGDRYYGKQTDGD